MSFILDALKKSEAERNRKSGPVLMDMRIAPPRRQLPVWVWVIAHRAAGQHCTAGLRAAARQCRSRHRSDRGCGSSAVPAPAPAASERAAAPALPAPASATATRQRARTCPHELPAAAPAAGGVIMQSNAVVSPGNAAGNATAENNAGSAAPATPAISHGQPAQRRRPACKRCHASRAAAEPACV